MFDTSHFPLAIPSIKVTHIPLNKFMLLIYITSESVKTDFTGNPIQPILKFDLFLKILNVLLSNHKNQYYSL